MVKRLSATRFDWKSLRSNGLYFDANPKKEGHYTIRVSSGAHCITGETSLDRYNTLFRQGIQTIAQLRPGELKRVGSFPSSVFAEAVTLGVRAKSMGLAHEFKFEGVDVQPEYIEHARTLTFPKGMLYGKPAWLRNSFRQSADPNWVTPTSDIRDIITIHPPQDLRTFRSEGPVDLMFINNLFMHLEEDVVYEVLENLLPQSNGLVCMAGKLERFAMSDQSPEYLRACFTDAGFVFADPECKRIRPANDNSSFLRHTETDAFIAIHPELLAQMVA